MKRPRDLSSTPRGDWCYRQPETGMTFKELHPKALEQAVFQHRTSLPALGMDVSGGWRTQFWNDVCEQNPQIPWEDTEARRYYPTLVDVWYFVQTLWGWKQRGGKFVEQEEAERRAMVCLTGAGGHPCPHNEVFAPCLGCRGVSEEVSRLLGGRTTEFDSKLHLCTACGGCKLSAKIHFPLEAIAVNEEKLPAWCWQRKGAPAEAQSPSQQASDASPPPSPNPAETAHLSSDGARG